MPRRQKNNVQKKPIDLKKRENNKLEWNAEATDQRNLCKSLLAFLNSPKMMNLFKFLVDQSILYKKWNNNLELTGLTYMICYYFVIAGYSELPKTCMCIGCITKTCIIKLC